MTAFEKIATGFIAIGMATTLLLPDRTTVAVFRTVGDWFNTALKTSMGR